MSENWGKLLYIDGDYLGMNSLTSARTLIQTKQKSRIEEWIRLDWGVGSCEVWVKEVGCCACLDVSEIIEKRSKHYEDSEQDTDEHEVNEQRNKVTEEEVGIGSAEDEEQHKKDGAIEMEANNECSFHINTYNDPIMEGKYVEQHDNKNCDMNTAGRDMELEKARHVDYQINMLVEIPGVAPLVSDNFDPVCQEELVSYDVDGQNGIPIQMNNVYCTVGAEEGVLSPDLGNQFTSFNPTPTKFDPMMQVECVLLAPSTPTVRRYHDRGPNSGLASTSKKPRGRPKRNTTDPLTCTQPCSSRSNSEINRTWETAKLIGVSSNEEEAVMRELRKSKRLATLVETAH